MQAPRRPRLLRHTPGTMDGLGQVATHGFAAEHALVHYMSGGVFTFIPKNACTSLRVSLALANGVLRDVSEWTWVHKNNTTFSASLPDLARAPATAVILRCPFRRLASVFLDKIVSRQGELWALHRKSGDTIDVDALTFRQFVHWIAQPGFRRMDIHWRPQTDFLVYDTYDRVFGMHDVAAFGTYFEDVTGQPFVDSRPFSGHVTSEFETGADTGDADTPLSVLTAQKSAGRLPRVNALFDDALVAFIARLYGDDLVVYRDLVGIEGLLFPDLDVGENE